MEAYDIRGGWGGVGRQLERNLAGRKALEANIEGAEMEALENLRRYTVEN